MSEVDALKKMIIENMLKDLMNIQPAHIHIDLDKNGCTEKSFEKFCEMFKDLGI